MVSGRVLVGAERVQAALGRVPGQRGECLPGDEPALPPDGNKLPDLMAVAAHVRSVAAGATAGARELVGGAEGAAGRLEDW